MAVLERLPVYKEGDTVVSSVLESVDTSITDDKEVTSGTTKLEETIPDEEGVITRVDGTSWLKVSDTDALVEEAVNCVPGLAESLEDTVIEGTIVAVGRTVIL